MCRVSVLFSCITVCKFNLKEGWACKWRINCRKLAHRKLITNLNIARHGMVSCLKPHAKVQPERDSSADLPVWAVRILLIHCHQCVGIEELEQLQPANTSNINLTTMRDGTERINHFLLTNWHRAYLRNCTGNRVCKEEYKLSTARVLWFIWVDVLDKLHANLLI